MNLNSVDNVILKGSLDSLPLGDLFELLRYKKGPVRARINLEKKSIDFYLDKGKVVWADSKGEIEPIGAYLVKTGAITNEALVDYISEYNGNKTVVPFGKFLIDKGAVTDEDVNIALRDRILDLTSEINLERQGEIEVKTIIGLPDYSVPNLLPVDLLLLETARRMDEEAGIVDLIGSLDVPMRLQSQDLSGEIKFSGEEWAVLKLINGKRTINNILRISNQPRLEVLQSVAAFFNLGILVPVITGLYKYRILVVDDSLTQRHLVVYVLSEAGFDTVEAGDGETALKIAFAEPPDLVILDVILPGINGYEVCSRLKKDKRTGTVPIILLTSKTGITDKIKGKLVGADIYLTKPFEEEEIIKVSQKLTTRRRYR
jgi:CheY-like chemotaxis protein